MTREELNQSNQTNILGAGKVTKNRHWTHNDNIADYVDESIGDIPENADVVAAIVEEVLNTDTIKDIEAKTPWVTPEMFGYIEGDATAYIQQALDYCVKISNVTLQNTRAYQGGGGVLLNNTNGNIYEISAPILISPKTTLKGYGAIIKLTTESACIRQQTTLPVQQYDKNGIFIEGIDIDGNSIAKNGIVWTRVVESGIKNVNVYKTVEDGIVLQQCQWNNFEQVNASKCGGYGLWLGKSEDDGYKSNNNSFTRVKTEGCANGVYIGDAEANSFFAFTSQFNEGVGVYMFGANCRSNAFFAPHLEANEYHVQIIATTPATDTGTPQNNAFYSPYFFSAADCIKFVQNQGKGTLIQSPVQQNSALPTVSGSNSPYEQNRTSGYMMVVNPPTITGQAFYVCYDNGANFTQANNNQSRVSILRPEFNGLGFQGSMWFDNPSASTKVNCLKIENNYVWVDSNNRLRARNVRPSNIDDSGSLLSIVGYSEINTIKKRTVIDADTTMLDTDYIIEFQANTAPRKVTFLPAQDMSGKTIIIKDWSGNAASFNITLDATGFGTIDGTNTKLIYDNYGFIHVYSDGSRWNIIANSVDRQRVNGNFYYTGAGIQNSASFNNGRVETPSTGVIVARSVVDGNPAQITLLGSAGSTANIHEFRDSTGLVSSISRNGFFRSPSITTTIDFGSVAANSELAAPSTITLTGAAVGDVVLIGAPNTTGIVYKGIVTSTNTVTLYACNFTTSAVDPTSSTFKLSIIK